MTYSSFDQIIESKINGQHKQCFEQFMTLCEWDKLQFIAELDQEDKYERETMKYLFTKLTELYHNRELRDKEL